VSAPGKWREAVASALENKRHGVGIRCPFCKLVVGSLVIETRLGPNNSERRRRECSNCRKRFTTYETYEEDAA